MIMQQYIYLFISHAHLNLICLLILIAYMCSEMNMKCLNNMFFMPSLQIDYYS